MKVFLEYFKSNGKYYSDGEYQSTLTYLFEIWEEVRKMRMRGELPGLVKGAHEFIVLINVPDHPNNHPHLLPLSDVLNREARLRLRTVIQNINELIGE